MLYDDLGITNREELDNHMSHERFLEFLRKYPICEVSRDSNSYGEFTFVSLRVERPLNAGGTYTDCLQFYGNGTHKYRDITPPFWWFNIGNGFIVADKSALNKGKVITQIERERQIICFDNTPKDNYFTLMADISDDDCALINVFWE